MKWHVGTSGWSYWPWRGQFYPREIPSREWISFYARHFNSVELNSSFYHPPKPQQLVNWEKKVPKDFIFSIKASRTITHEKRLNDSQKTVPPFLDALTARHNKGPIIFQLPPRFPKNVALLESFLETLPKQQRVAIEFRDPSWHEDDVFKILKRHKIAFCLFEKGKLFSPRIVTAPFVYVRLHGREEGYKGNYSDDDLREWHAWLKKQKRDVYIYFDNTAQKTYATDNALSFKRMAEDS